ncbi:conserved Plasmodium protein, unknown function [Plasmodium gallinaceum]|uniref:UAS domain-containing protein n=1 Tax=Plasmodium gallinaceum TaxID=5849 RepID=A0A1J1GV03_PLAGA|nr:conserved Plasmodium protein, unknown function [Plasmodium gallinaceum]CRG96290.1 conserved Plasmodium protein, unknown function [Plasmodium gallinaceum]
MISKNDIDEFLRNTEDTTEETALYYLEMCNGNCKDALNLYYEINGGNNSENDRRNAEEQQLKEYNHHDTNECNENIRSPDKHFSQKLIHDMDESNFLHFREINKKEKKTKIDLGGTFEKLFSPPESLICSLSFEEVRKKSKEENKFILVNIQNSEFDSMRLNRDIWNNDIIQQILKDFFIFWLRYEYEQEAMIFMNTYKVNKLPYICVLCKRTGRLLKVWNTKHFEDPVCAQSQLYEFIEMIELKNNVNNINNNKNNNSVNNTLNDLEKNKINYNVDDNKLYNTTKEIKYIEEIQKDIDKNINPSNPLNLSENKERTSNNENIKDYNKINNELSELHKLRLQRLQKK